MDYLKNGHTLEDFPGVNREQAVGYLEMTLEAAEGSLVRARAGPR